MKVTLKFDSPFGKHEKIINTLKVPTDLEPYRSLLNGLALFAKQKSMMILPIEIEIQRDDKVEKLSFIISTLSDSGSYSRKINDIDTSFAVPSVSVIDDNRGIVKPRKWWRELFKR
jgi:hypothetical protein